MWRDKASGLEADPATPTVQPPSSQSYCLEPGKLPTESLILISPCRFPRYPDARRLISADLIFICRFTDLRLPDSEHQRTKVAVHPLTLMCPLPSLPRHPISCRHSCPRMHDPLPAPPGNQAQPGCRPVIGYSLTT